MKVLAVKNVTVKLFNGETRQDKYELRSYGSWNSIVKTFQGEESTQNEFGGYSPIHTGSEKYIKGLWSKI